MDLPVKEISVRELRDDFAECFKGVEERNLRFLIVWRRFSSGLRGLLVPIQEWQLLCYFRGEGRTADRSESAATQQIEDEMAFQSGTGHNASDRTSAALVLNRIMSVDQFRQRMAATLEDVATSDACYILTRDEREVAAVIPPKYLSELKIYLRLQVRDICAGRSDGRTLLGDSHSESVE